MPQQSQILSPQQIAQLAYNAGFRGAALNQAVAIALAESGGRYTAYNPETGAGTPQGSGSRGLWQIYGAAHPEYNSNAAFDPQTNANAAYKVYLEAGSRFTPWSTYNQGLAKPRYDFAATIKGSSKATQAGSSQIINASGQAAGVMNSTGVNNWQELLSLPSTLPSLVAEGVATGTTQAAASTVKFLFPQSKEDYIFMIVGFILGLVGVVFLLIAASQTEAGQQVTSAAAKTVAAAALV